MVLILVHNFLTIRATSHSACSEQFRLPAVWSMYVLSGSATVCRHTVDVIDTQTKSLGAYPEGYQLKCSSCEDIHTDGLSIDES